MSHLQNTPSRSQQRRTAPAGCNCNSAAQRQQNLSQLKNLQVAYARNQSPPTPQPTKRTEFTLKQENTIEGNPCTKCIRSEPQVQQTSQKCENVLPPCGSRSQQPLKAQQNNGNNGFGVKKPESRSDKCGCALENDPCTCDLSAPQGQVTQPQQTNNKCEPTCNSNQSPKSQQSNGTKGSGAKQTETQTKCRCTLEYLWKTYGIHMDSFPCLCPNIKNQKESHKSQQSAGAQGSGAKQTKSSHKCGCALEYLWKTYGMVLESFPCICSNMKNQNKSQKQQTSGTQDSKAKQTNSQPACRCTLEYLWHTYGMHMESFPCICSKLKKTKPPEKSDRCCSPQGSGEKQTKPQPGCKCTLEYLWQTYGILMENFPCICSQSVPNQSQKSQQSNQGAKVKQTEQPSICGCASENLSSNRNNSAPQCKPTESLTAIFNKRYFEWNCNPPKSQDCCPQNKNSLDTCSGAKKNQSPLQCDCDKPNTQQQTQTKYADCSCDQKAR